MKNIKLYEVPVSTLPMHCMSVTFFWPLRYMEILMTALWAADARMLNSPDRGYYCHEIGGTE
ncbi:MAG: hypothetical protein V2I97_14195 [Desulfococcaceae bacterium]|nr:hypothetical protein [Desulfococcaceae bacterium]